MHLPLLVLANMVWHAWIGKVADLPTKNETNAKPEWNPVAESDEMMQGLQSEAKFFCLV